MRQPLSGTRRAKETADGLLSGEGRFRCTCIVGRTVRLARGLGRIHASFLAFTRSIPRGRTFTIGGPILAQLGIPQAPAQPPDKPGFV